MLESELHDRESHDNTTGGRDAGELTPAVPAAVFQPPQVVFQPPAARPDPVSAPSQARTETASQPASSGPAGPAEAGDDDDAASTGRRRRRRSGRGRGRNGEQDTPEAGDGAPQAQDAEPGQEPAADAAGSGGQSGGQGDGKRPSSRSRSRRTARSGAAGEGTEAPAEAPAAEGQPDGGGGRRTRFWPSRAPRRARMRSSDSPSTYSMAMNGVFL